jgi:N-acetylglucosaminyldiphosphoundecaprenol N-acetyl-beta-D-mannosaminyltransferase
VPVIWYSRWLGEPIPERICGTDLVEEIAGLSALHGWSLFFLGSTPCACKGAIDHLRARHPRMVVAGSYQPPFGEWNGEEEARMAARVRSSRADVVFVGLGPPKQECWVHRFGASSGAPVLIGIGGSFDILSGHLRRAPPWMRRSGLEWAWRLMLEPRRLAGRYLVRDVRFAVEIIRDYFVKARGKT